MSTLEAKVDIESLAEHVLGALGVSGHGDAAHIMDHSIAQACLELETIERVLERSPGEDLAELVYTIEGIRRRLTLARNSAGYLATLLPNESEAAE